MRTKLEKHGSGTLNVEVTNISAHGLWVFTGSTEYFLPYIKFPWFKDATIAQISNVQLHHKEHLFWEDLDVDLTLHMITNPEEYPLIDSHR